MKKILLGTSALIGAATLLSGAALAEDPKVTVGGFNTFEAAYTESDKFDDNLRNRAFRNNTELHFNIAGKTGAGLNYGAEIDLQADVDGAGPISTSGATGGGLNARRTYGWLGGDAWGHIEIGSNDGVNRTMKVDATSIARATGGIDGDWTYFANVNSNGTAVAGENVGAGSAGTLAGVTNNNYITGARLPVEHGPATGFFREAWGNNNKITYYTPKFAGFQLGVSYSPDLENRGQFTDRIDRVTAGTVTARDIWEGALSYEGQFSGIGVAAAVTGQTGKALENSGLEDLGAWNAGAKVSYMGFSLAGSYGDWDDSLTTETAGSQVDADYWTVGLAYETGPFGASATYLQSDTEVEGTDNDNEFQAVSVGVDYKLAPGLTPFVEWTWYDIDPQGAAGASDSDGNVVIVGSQLSF